jgi:hypothetical protein
VTAPGPDRAPAPAAALRELDDLEGRAAALAAAIGRELAELEQEAQVGAPWDDARRDLAERVLPLSLKDPGAGPVARRLLALERRQRRLVREGASLRAQSEALRRYLEEVRRRLRARPGAHAALPGWLEALRAHHRHLAAWSDRLARYERGRRRRRLGL